jgi:hypothetical protein
MHLFVITALSDLLLLELFKCPDAMVITPIPQLANELINNHGVQAKLLTVEGKLANDKLFFDEFMPGKLDGLKLHDMPLHETMSIDRLRFWFNGEPGKRLADIILSLDLDELFISFDINHFLPWAVAKRANAYVTAIKTHPLRTREVYDLLPHLPFDNIIVSFEDEKEYIKSLCPNIEVKISESERPTRRAVESQRKLELRDGLKLQKDATITAVVFDKRDEWQFYKFLQIGGQRLNLMVFPYDSRSAELFRVPLSTYDDMGLMDVCDELVMFRFSEEVYNSAPDIPVVIYDFFNLNASKEVALRDVKVVI